MVALGALLFRGGHRFSATTALRRLAESDAARFCLANGSVDETVPGWVPSNANSADRSCVAGFFFALTFRLPLVVFAAVRACGEPTDAPTPVEPPPDDMAGNDTPPEAESGPATPRTPTCRWFVWSPP